MEEDENLETKQYTPEQVHASARNGIDVLFGGIKQLETKLKEKSEEAKRFKEQLEKVNAQLDALKEARHLLDKFIDGTNDKKSDTPDPTE